MERSWRWLGFCLALGACGEREPVPSSSSFAGLTVEQCSYFAVGDEVTICHRTSSARKPYTIIRTNLASCGGHAGHEGDHVAHDDPTCSGQGCFPHGAPVDGTVECCGNLVVAAGTCACPAGTSAAADGRSCVLSDACPEDASKTEPGVCGCGVSDADSDGDAAADCVDECADDPGKTAAGDCGCGVAEGSCCTGAAPIDGVASPVAASNRPEQIAADALNVYWGSWPTSTTAGALWQAPRGGGAAASLFSLESLHEYVKAAASDGVEVYFGASDGVIRSVPVGGGAPAVRASPGIGLQFFAVDATNLYFTRSVSGVGGIYRMAKATGAVTTIDASSSQVCRAGLAVDATHVYWAEDGCFSCATSNGRILRAPVGGGAVAVIASGQAHPNFVAVDGHDVYWTNLCDGTVMTAPKAGGAATTLATGQAAPQGIAVHDGFVYWTRSSSASPGVARVSACGGAPTTLFSGGSNPQTLVIDGGRLFWNDFQDGSVMSLP